MFLLVFEAGRAQHQVFELLVRVAALQDQVVDFLPLRNVEEVAQVRFRGDDQPERHVCGRGEQPDYWGVLRRAAGALIDERGLGVGQELSAVLAALGLSLDAHGALPGPPCVDSGGPAVPVEGAVAVVAAQDPARLLAHVADLHVVVAQLVELVVVLVLLRDLCGHY